MRAMLSAGLGLLLTATGAAAASRPVVVELFTSQGCSSCPPADALLTTLARRPGLLALAFHVTYWNSLGWRDPYSLEASTDRQALYAARLGGGSYTPEMVVDGRRGMVGSEAAEVDAAIAAAQASQAAALAVRLEARTGAVSVTIGRGEGHGRVLVVGFDPHHDTPVGRGENGGRTLAESNVVRSIRTLGQYDGSAFHADVPPGQGRDLAVIVQAPDGHILGAARL